MYFVQQTKLEALLDEAGRAHRDVLLAGRSPGLFYRTLHAIGNERERGAFVVPAFGNGVGDDEDRDVFAYGMPASPTIRNVERPPSRHDRPDRGEHLAQHL